MSRKMLIDAAHPDEIRVAIIKDGNLEELDYQNSKKKSTKGNIYLAKVTRVEPSLQAAFIEYGGERHGFLPFSEIHPDYYQIPVSDREKLLEEIRAFNGMESTPKRKPKILVKDVELSGDAEGQDLSGEEIEVDENIVSINSPVIDVAEDDNQERPEFYKRYKIQEVIKKDQVILVQIEKDERGNKGPALTTYVSLAGRLSVLMPNATKGGGVSRKNADASDRERLKNIAKQISSKLPNFGALIIRTAGAFQTEAEIKRDYQYLQKLWDNIREHTIKSNAPTFIHEEGDIVKKAIRDLYDNTISEIIIQGDVAFKEANEFMQMNLPKNINKLIKHDGKISIFSKFGVEQQVAELYSNQVPLKSGGYLVINQTEALVAIDINSGRATSERNVENTAYRTNLEAAHEIARQLGLRDLSGLIVIDFIDMEDNKNKRIVEKTLKEALAGDKAKIQIGRISHFGLLEMSRQRIKQSFMETNTEICKHCQGRGRIRQIEASALAVIRAVENEMSHEIGEIIVSASSNLISYLLNNKRAELAKIDTKFKKKIMFLVDESAGGDGFYIDKKRIGKDMIAKRALSRIDDTASSPTDDAATPLIVTSSDDDVPVETTRPQSSNFKHQNRNKNNRHLNTGANKNSNSEDNTPHPNTDNKRGKFKINKPNNFSPKSNSPHAKNNGVIESEISHASESTKPPHKHKWKNDSNRNKVPKPSFVDEADESTEKEYETQMAERRKANQSLLKEIWKKIVD